MGFVLDIEENFTPGHSPGWWQEVLVSDVSPSAAAVDYFLLLENADFFLLESGDKLILG